MKLSIRRWARVLAVVLVFSAGLAAPTGAQATTTVSCNNADSLKPPYNLVDKCYAGSPVDTNYVAELTGGDDCGNASHTNNRQRINVLAHFVGGYPYTYLSIDSIGIRYLSGTYSYAYYEVLVYDGTGYAFKRSWNNYGNTIYSDGAILNTNNTVNITPNYGFAPTFGSGGYVKVWIKPHFFAGAQDAQKCVGDGMVAQFVEP